MSDVSGIVSGMSDMVIGTKEPDDFQRSDVVEDEMLGSDGSYHSESEVSADIGEPIDIPTGLGV